MSSSDPSDPRMLLPEWLRDGDALSVPTPSASVSDEAVPSETPQIIESPVEPAANLLTVPVAPPTPYSDRLSLDTRLDPGELVSAADLPKWLGGLEQVIVLDQSQTVQPAMTTTAPRAIAIEEAAPYEGVDAPQAGVVDIEANGWILIAAALGLLVLLLAALKLYLS